MVERERGNNRTENNEMCNTRQHYSYKDMLHAQKNEHMLYPETTLLNGKQIFTCELDFFRNPQLNV